MIFSKQPRKARWCSESVIAWSKSEKKDAKSNTFFNSLTQTLATLSLRLLTKNVIKTGSLKGYEHFSERYPEIGLSHRKICCFRKKMVIFSDIRPSHFPCISKSARFSSLPKNTITSAKLPQHVIRYSSSWNQNVSSIFPWNVLPNVVSNSFKNKDRLVKVVRKYHFKWVILSASWKWENFCIFCVTKSSYWQLGKKPPLLKEIFAKIWFFSDFGLKSTQNWKTTR